MHLRRRGNKVYALFVDFRHAFDSIPQSLLWQKMYQLSVSPKLIRVIKSLYDAATIQVRTQTGYSSEVEVSEGVLQGEILSPLLFIIFIADIIPYFCARGVRGININDVMDLLMTLYADDLAILAYSPADLRQKLRILSDYCSENGLTVNISKTKIIVFRKSGRLDRYSRCFIYNGEPIEIVSSHPYLGATLSSSALGLRAANIAVTKIKTASSSVLSILSSAKVDA